MLSISFYTHTARMKDSGFFKFVLLVNILSYSAQWSVDDTGCITPEREVGDCISIQSCSTVTNFLSKHDVKSLDERSRNYIRRFLCARDAIGVKVCCPRTPINLDNIIFNNSRTNQTPRFSSLTNKFRKCKTAAQDEGSCIALQSCHQIKNLISTIKNTFDTQRKTAKEQYPCTNSKTEINNRTCTALITFMTPINETENDEIKSALEFYQCGEDSEGPMVCCLEQSQTDPTFHPNSKLLPNNKCVFSEVDDPNLPEKFLYGGMYAHLFEFPWMVALKYQVKNNEGGQENFHCGAVLISRRYLLTAAHCVVTRKVSLTGARVGEIDLNKLTNFQISMFGSNPEDLEITEEDAIVHPNYNPITMTNDIALIRLRKNVQFSDSTRPICLPVRLKSRSNKFEDRVTVAGWGETENGSRSTMLLKIDVPVVPPENCSNHYANLMNITNKQLCAGGEATSDTCRGDSGGPLMSEVDIGMFRRTVLYGIVSYGPTRCAKKDFPAVYTRVTSYLNWILDNIKP